MELRIKVGASADASLTSVFKPLLKASAEARRAIEAQAAASQAATGKSAAAGAAAQASAAKKGETSQAESIRRVQALRNKDHADFLREMGEREGSVNKLANAEERAAKKRVEAQQRVGTAAARTFAMFARAGAGVVSRAASAGFGVDVDLFAAMGAARETHDIAGKATRSAFTAAGKTATEADVQATVKAIQEGGDKAKLGYQGMAEGLEDFVSKSADLQTGNAVLGKMGIIAQATGANVKDLLSAAGDVNRELGDSPDKAERLLAIMRLVAKQGAMGNVEVKDLAKYMGRLTASAFMYEGTKDRNIGILGALAQVAMKGGATDAAEATRSAAAFARDLTKASTLKTFGAKGIEVFADKGKTKVRSPEEIIVDALTKTKGDLGELSKLFKNDASRKAMLGFANIYSEAGGGSKGLAVVRGEFKRYSTSMSEEEVNAQAKTALEGTTAAAQQFKNDLEKLGGEVAAELAPALRELAPVVLQAVRAFGGIVSFGAQNPGAMVAAALVASIGKAAIGEAVGKALSGALGSATIPIAVGVATFMITKAIVESTSEQASKGENASLDADIMRANARTSAKRALEGKKDPVQALADATAAAADDMRRLNQLKTMSGISALDYFDTLNPFGNKTVKSVSEAKADAPKEKEIKEDLAHQQEVIGALRELIAATRANKPVPAGAPGPAVDDSARSSGVK